MILFFDSETIEHPDVPAKVSDDGKDRVPAAPHLRIVAACGILAERRECARQTDVDSAGTADAPVPIGDTPRPRLVPIWYEFTHAVHFGTTAVPDERQIIERIAKALEKRPKIVTYNGRGFDERVAVAAAMEHGVPVSYLFDRDVSYRYSNHCHEDLLDTLTNYGSGKAGGQDAWARRCGLPGKMGVDGSQVKDLYAADKYQEIREYCMCDTGQLSGVWLRKELISGGLTLDGYRASVASWMKLCERTPALRAIVEHPGFDRKRFLMEA